MCNVEAVFGEEGERFREDRASFLLGLAKGLQKKIVKSDGFLRILLKRILHYLTYACVYVAGVITLTTLTTLTT